AAGDDQPSGPSTARPGYLPDLAAAEIDVLLGPAWPMRPGRALQLTLEELLASGGLVSLRPDSAWPIARRPGIASPRRAVLASIAKLFGAADNGLHPAEFCAQMYDAYGDTLRVRKGLPAGYPLEWFSIVIAQGLTADGVAAIGEQPGYMIGDVAHGVRTGL